MSKTFDPKSFFAGILATASLAALLAAAGNDDAGAAGIAGSKSRQVRATVTSVYVLDTVTGRFWHDRGENFYGAKLDEVKGEK